MARALCTKRTLTSRAEPAYGPRVRGILIGAAACGGLLGACRGDTSTPPDATPPAPDVPVTTLADLRFAVVGDTRPVNVDDTANYPTAVISTIWADVAAESPAPAFAISTGDYMFANVGGAEQAPQLDLYLGARGTYTAPIYAAMGNHECNGYTASNCGPGTTDGETTNYNMYMQRMVAPLGFTHPWFDAYFAAADGTWTAKVVVIAANAWNADQAAWLDTALSVPSTYTFVVRHESNSADTAPGVTPSQGIIGRHPLTLLIVGHTHTYQHQAAEHEVIIGNGGAPLSGGVDYGYAIVERRTDGAIQLSEHDYQTKAVVDAFAVGADGAPH